MVAIAADEDVGFCGLVGERISFGPAAVDHDLGVLEQVTPLK